MAVFSSKGPVGTGTPCLLLVFCLSSGVCETFDAIGGWKTFAVLLLGMFHLVCGVCWEEGGLNYLYDLLFRQTVGRAVNAFDHSAPSIIILFPFGICWPLGKLLLIGVIVAGACRR